MKNSLKKKVFILAAAVLMTVSMIPASVFAAVVNKYENTGTADAADIVFGVNSSSTNVQPGDTFTVKITVDKVPSNGLGISSLGLKIAYDSTKVELVDDGDSYQLAGALNIEDYTDGVDADVDADATDRVITITGAKEATSKTLLKTTGDFAILTFKAKDTVTKGNLGMYVKGTYDFEKDGATLMSKGFVASGVSVDGDDNLQIDDTVVLFLNSNLESLAATVNVTGVSFDITGETLEKGDTVDVSGNLVITPAAAVDGADIEWNTGDATVATVTNGVITAVGAGTTTISATVGGRTAAITVSVTVPLDGITLEDDEMVIYKGDSANFVVIKDPADATGVVINSSLKSGEGIISVDGTKVTGLAKGDAVVQVVANKGTAEEQIAELKVTVKENPITSITVSDVTVDLLRHEDAELTFTYTTEESESIHVTTDDKTPTWVSSDVAVVTVDANGKLVAIGEGTATITLTVAGKTATTEVTVTEKPFLEIIVGDEIADVMNAEGFVLVVGEPFEIPFIIDPADCTDTVEEILAKVEFTVTDNVKFEIEYNKETGEGKIILTALEAGVVEGEFEVVGGTQNNGYSFTFDAVDPVVEEEEVENPETGDMNIVALSAVMMMSACGLVVTKKYLVK